MTGSSSTSILKMYEAGQREIYGIKFRDGYRAHEKLDNVGIIPAKVNTTIQLPPMKLLNKDTLL